MAINGVTEGGALISPTAAGALMQVDTTEPGYNTTIAGFIKTRSGSPVYPPPATDLVIVSLGSPALGTTTAVHAAVTDTGSQQVVTSAITNPDVPRNITATAGGTAADVAAISVIVEGTNAEGAFISETLPAFTVNATGTVVGNKAFKTVTKITIPAHDGTGATTAIGTGSKLGLNTRLNRNGVLRALLNGVQETTAPTVTVNATDLESNTASLNSALAGTPVVLYVANDAP